MPARAARRRCRAGAADCDREGSGGDDWGEGGRYGAGDESAGELTPLGLVPRYQRFRVVGIFKSGFYQYDSSYAFMRLADAQRLFSEPDLISVISFKVDDLYKADGVGTGDRSRRRARGFRRRTGWSRTGSCFGR